MPLRAPSPRTIKLILVSLLSAALFLVITMGAVHILRRRRHMKQTTQQNRDIEMGLRQVRGGERGGNTDRLPEVTHGGKRKCNEIPAVQHPRRVYAPEQRRTAYRG